MPFTVHVQPALSDTQRFLFEDDSYRPEVERIAAEFHRGVPMTDEVIRIRNGQDEVFRIRSCDIRDMRVEDAA